MSSELKVERLRKVFATGVAAVDDVSFRIAPGEIVVLLGPSGCGKTTTLRLIAGYIVPDSGTIETKGRILSSPNAVVSPESRGMGMVFQNYAIWPHKTVFQNVVFGLKLRRVPAAEAKKKVADTLALVNLAGLEARYPNELSGGQQQRVALARSLVVEPEILLLDEPLSNLDAKLRERMRVELKELQRRTGITFVYVTHDQAEALALSDQIAVMNGGQVQQYGTPFDVYARPANRMVADFMGLVNLVLGTMREVKNGAGTVTLGGGLTVDVAMAEGLRAGDPVDISIRPENVHLAPVAGAPANTAKITNHVFLGNISEYYVALPDGQVLRVQTHPSVQYATGAEVAIEIDGRQCSAFPRSGAAGAAA